MKIQERVAGLLVTRASRLAGDISVDRHHIDTLPPVPPSAAEAPAPRPANPWDAARAHVCMHGLADLRRQNDEVLDLLLQDASASADDIRQLYDRVRTDDRLAGRVLGHQHAPSDLVLSYVLDTRHDTPSFSRDTLNKQVSMLQRLTGVTGERRVEAWATLVARAANSPAAAAEISAVLMASPNATVVLHHAVLLVLARSANVPDELARHLLSHLSAPATIAALTLRHVLHIIDDAKHSGLRCDRLIDVVCDMLAASCGSDTERWEAFFGHADTWPGSLGSLLDAVENGAFHTAATIRRDRSDYQRNPRSRLLRPIDYSALRVNQARSKRIA